MAYAYDWRLVYVQRCGGIDAEGADLDDDSDDDIPQLQDSATVFGTRADGSAKEGKGSGVVCSPRQ